MSDHQSTTVPSSQLVPQLLPRNFREPLPRHTARDACRLRIALAQVRSVQIIRFLESGLDELLDLETGRVVEAVEFLLDV